MFFLSSWFLNVKQITKFIFKIHLMMGGVQPVMLMLQYLPQDTVEVKSFISALNFTVIFKL